MHGDRVALVTGAARGLGLSIAERLGTQVAALILCDADVEAADRAASAFRERGMTCAAFSVDVSDPSSVESLFATLDNRFGRLDILVNSAGIQGLHEGKKPLVEAMPIDLWRRTLDVNLTGTFLMCKAAIPLMKRGRWGRIVNMSSRAARMRTGIGNANYAASKAGLIGFSRVLAGEVGRDGITVNCIAPSRVKTDMTRAFENAEQLFEANLKEVVVGRLCEPRDIASSVVFLCSDDASFLTGTVLDVSGGSFMP